MNRLSHIRHSLLTRLGLVMAAITLLAISSMAASLFVADTIQGEATAINESGALRMRSYRIASSLVYELPDDQHWQTTRTLIDEFEHHLHSDDITKNIPADKNSHIRLAYQEIEDKWTNNIEPLFDLYLDGIRDLPLKENQTVDMSISKNAVINIRNQYFLVVTDFVSKIDNLVKLLEEDAETKIKKLRIYQYVSLVLTLILVTSSLILVYSRILIPMKQLLAGAKQARHRDFTYRTSYTREDELGQLGIAFNAMAEDLSHIYDDLEDRVKQKTIDLKRSNSSMELLYITVKRLSEVPSPQDAFTDILHDIENFLGTGKGTICLRNQKSEYAAMLASTLQTDDLSKQHCQEYNCNSCIGEGKSQLINIVDNNGTNRQVISLPIADQSQQYGILIIDPGKGKTIETWQQKLLENITTQIAIAINLSNQNAQSRRFSLLEERGAIARELHDSLAQSLTYMKIQVSRLQNVLKNKSSNVESDKVIEELKIGLNSAYRQLRELLTTFRLKIDGDDFNEVLQKTIDEFNERGETDIILSNMISYSALTPNEEIHIMQLIREALSNIMQHAKATQARVSMLYNTEGEIIVSIEDNGIGMKSVNSPQHHYGLSIMKERAYTLNGQLKIENIDTAGTIITLTFTPINKSTPLNTKQA